MNTNQVLSENSTLQFQPFSSNVNVGFWFELTKRKLEQLRLSEDPVQILGEYNVSQFTPSNAEGVEETKKLPSMFHLSADSFNSNLSPLSQVAFSSTTRGTLFNTNTSETFIQRISQEGNVLLDKVGSQIWEDIKSGAALKDPSLLTRFLLITFADIKKYVYWYWFAFPTITLEQNATATPPKQAHQVYGEQFLPSLSEKLKEKGIPPFFRILFQNNEFSVKNLDEPFDESQFEHTTFGFVDPCSLERNPGWPLRHFLLLISKHFKMNKVQILCFREHHNTKGNSIVLDVNLPSFPESFSRMIGWEKNTKGQLKARRINLSSTMDPMKLISASVDLNLKLMQWRLLPSLNLEKIQETKCLLFGAGTLGCNVARSLMSWGFRQITFVDNGTVSYSNPARQSLYEFEDCISGSRKKAEAASERMQKIFPGMETRGEVLTIPMPGHPIASGEESNVKETVSKIYNLIKEHDVVFILTDSRESRWLPTLFSASEGKLAMNTALGFDSYLAIRHGQGYRNPEQYEPELGCYFCNDVVAPQNSLRDRTLDQQCTVTRPGLSSMASAISVEMLVSLLHHPERGYAPADGPREVSNPTSFQFGIIPHSIRGFLTHYANLVIEGKPYNRCTACSPSVIEAFKKDDFEFLKKVFNDPTYLEDIAGLTEMKKESEEISWEVADEDDF